MTVDGHVALGSDCHVEHVGVADEVEHQTDVTDGQHAVADALDHRPIYAETEGRTHQAGELTGVLRVDSVAQLDHAPRGQQRPQHLEQSREKRHFCARFGLAAQALRLPQTRNHSLLVQRQFRGHEGQIMVQTRLRFRVSDAHRNETMQVCQVQFGELVLQSDCDAGKVDLIHGSFRDQA